jgi:hypothetical protein
MSSCAMSIWRLVVRVARYSLWHFRTFLSIMKKRFYPSSTLQASTWQLFGCCKGAEYIVLLMTRQCCSWGLTRALTVQLHASS